MLVRKIATRYKTDSGILRKHFDTNDLLNAARRLCFVFECFKIQRRAKNS